MSFKVLENQFENVNFFVFNYNNAYKIKRIESLF